MPNRCIVRPFLNAAKRFRANTEKGGLVMKNRKYCSVVSLSVLCAALLVEGRGDGEELAQIPRYLCGEDEDGNPILPGKKAKVISIRP
jgi:hypothetical protein